MADPLSITAGVIAVVTFALQGIKILCDGIGTYHDAGSTLTDLKVDVDATITTLESIDASLRNADDSGFSDSVKKCLQEAKPAITGCGNACKDFSNELAKTMSHSKEKSSRRDRVKLWFKEKKIQGFRYRLGSYKSTLNIVLTLASIKAIEKNQAQTSDLQRDLERAVNTIAGQIQGLAISEPAFLEAQETTEDEEGGTPHGVLEPQRVGLGECLKTCSYALAEVANQTGTTVRYAEALGDATQLLGAFGDISGTDSAGASVTIEKMIANDRAFQAGGAFSENAFLAALSRNKGGG